MTARTLRLRRRLTLKPNTFVRTCMIAVSTIAILVPAACDSNTHEIVMWAGRRLPTMSESALSLETSPAAVGGEHRVTCTGAIHEVVSFRLDVVPADSAIDHPAFRTTPFVSSNGARIDPEVVRIFRMHRVPVGPFPGWHLRSIPPNERRTNPLDVLVPVYAPQGGMPPEMLPGEVYDFWVDVTIPKFTLEGAYTGRIELTAHGRTVDSVLINLTVLPIALPADVDIPMIAEIDHRPFLRASAGAETVGNDAHRLDQPTSRSRELDDTLRSAMQMLHEHGLTPVLSDIAPQVRVDALGNISVEWQPYDAAVKPYVDGGAFDNLIPSRFWPMPIRPVFSSWYEDGSVSSPGQARLLGQYLSQCAEHFDANGWLDRSYALPPLPVEMRPETAEATRQFAILARQADERIAVASRLWPQDMTPYGWVEYPAGDISGAVDIWLPPAQFHDRGAMAAQRANGCRTWLSIDRPSFSGSIAAYARETDVRVLNWQATSLGVDAVYLGCVNRWPEGRDRLTPGACIRANPDILIYPGDSFGLTEPVASARLKYLRDGQQDAAMRTVLARRGLEHVAAALTRSIAPHVGSDAYRTHFADSQPIGWIDDPLLLDLARDIMTEALMTTPLDDSPEASTVSFARQATWRRFMLITRKLGLHVDGSRVLVSGSRTSWESTVACSLTITNGTRLPVSGVIRFADLPEGWQVADESRPVPPIEPNRSRRFVLTVRSETLPVGRGGGLSLPIEFETDEGSVYRCDAGISFVVAVQHEGTIRIDGDLSDWPPGLANVASGFQLISGAHSTPFSNRTALPHCATTGFVMRDADNLYIGINCETEGESVLVASRRNNVVYDDMIPMGEELVEILIDPLNAGTRSPSDLYHVAIKPSGTYLTEKGMAFDPPCGQRSAWPADVEVATGSTRGRWIAELRIPLAAFGRQSSEHTVWGLNLTRNDSPREEFSTWSGAVGNAYDPLAMGNLYLP